MTSPPPPDPYATLNVSKDATLTAIRSAYRKLVLTCHPDKVQDEALRAKKTHQFTQVQRAYEILSDEQGRKRYDDKVRSAELRAETLMTGTRGTRNVPEFAGPRGGVFENRGEYFFEERAPRRSYDSDDASPFEEPRSRRSAYDNSTSRRSSGRVQEERRKTREVEVERERERERERDRERLRTTKEAQRSSHSDRRRTRDKDRRRDYDDKHTQRRAYVEEESDSDSESTARYSSVRRDPYPRKTYEDTRRGDWEDTPRRRNQREVSEYPDHFEVKIMGAQDYISKSKVVSVPEGSSRRPLAYRTGSAAQPPPPPPPPPPPAEPERRLSGGRTRGARDSSRTRSGKSARSPEIVDAPSRYDTPTRKPSMPFSSSDPVNLKVPFSQRREPVRPTTGQVPVYSQPEPRMPRLRRSETSPLVVGSPRRPDVVPRKSSKLKNSELHDSGYSSLSGPGTPEMAYTQQAAKYKAGVSDEDEDHFRGPPSTKYKVISDEDEDRFRGHRTYLVEPEEVTPKLNRRASERPAAVSRGTSTGTRGPPPRSQSYAYPVESHSSPRPPGFSRSETSRPSYQTRPSTRGSLFGELTEEPLQYKEPPPYKVQYETPKIRPQDIRYSSDRRGSGASPRDAYPYAEIRRPGLERRGDSYQSVCS